MSSHRRIGGLRQLVAGRRGLRFREKAASFTNFRPHTLQVVKSGETVYASEPGVGVVCYPAGAMTESGEAADRRGLEPLVVETFAVGSLGCNCSLVYERDSRRAIVIDPGDDPEALLQAVGERGLKVTQLLHTHAHFDHIGGSDAVKRRLGTPILLHRDDEELYRRLQEQGLLFGIRVPPPGEVDQFIEEGFEVMLGARTLLTTIHTPGHSPGSCCFYTEVTGKPLLFAGDTLFRQSVGRTDLPGGDPYALIKSIKQRLFELPAESYVVPGHGEHTTLHAEQRHNPFL